MTPDPGAWTIGIDVGASGARARAVRGGVRGGAATDGDVREARGVGAAAVPGGAGVAVQNVLAELRRQLGAAPVAALAVGATGLGTMTLSRADLRDALAEACGTDAIVLAADAVTAHIGALGGAAGVTVAAGTGAIAIADDGAGSFTRVDGWGHLLGDRGSAAWIGRAALDRALAVVDGRADDAGALLAAACERFGPPLTWPAAIYGRDDRAAILGTMAPIVDRLAATGDGVCGEILDGAADELASSARACLRVPGTARTVAWTGGVFGSARVRERFSASLADEASVHPAIGTPLDGAVALARRRHEAGPGADVAGLVSW